MRLTAPRGNILPIMQSVPYIRLDRVSRRHNSESKMDGVELELELELFIQPTLKS